MLAEICDPSTLHFNLSDYTGTFTHFVRKTKNIAISVRYY